MKLVVLGSGALGAYYDGLLARAGHDVTRPTRALGSHAHLGGIRAACRLRIEMESHLHLAVGVAYVRRVFGSWHLPNASASIS